MAAPVNFEPFPSVARSSGYQRWIRVGVALGTLAVLIRLNNAIRYPSLNGYDSFGHLTYIFYLLKTGEIPHAHQGWSFFHPPLYYALAAALWTPLQQVDPKQVLKVLNVVFSFAGLVPAWISYAVARRLFPHNGLARVMAPIFVLFLPVGLYSTPMLGNEGLNTILCALALYCLLRMLEQPHWRRALLLGTVLGLALLTKATAVALAATVVVVGSAWTVHTRRWREGAVNLSVALATAALLCGWYYAGNLVRYGTPFAMSRSYRVVQHVENAFEKAARGPGAYLCFDPRIVTEVLYRNQPLIDCVWSGVYGGAWFEVGGRSFMPDVQDHPWVRLVAQMVLVLGAVPTAVAALGLLAAVRRSSRRRWNDALVVLLTTFVVVTAMFIVYTHHVPTFSAVKTSYLLPAIVPWSIWFALGIDVLSRWRRVLLAVLTECALLLALIVPLFTYQLVLTADLSAFYWNSLGATYYLAGFHDRAQEILSAVARGYHLYGAHESLAAIALDDGRNDEALHELEQAKQLLADQIFGKDEERDALQRLVTAEYDSTEAAIYHDMGRDDLAMTAAQRAVEQAPEMAEAHYNLAALLLRTGATDAGSREAKRAVELDPEFTEAWALAGITAAETGQCPAAVAQLRRAASDARPRRTYPWQTGSGDVFDVGLARRRIIALCSAGLDPYHAWHRCAGETGGAALRLPWLPGC